MRRHLLVLALLFGCGKDTPSDDRIPLSVFAASSLAESFADIERDFEADNPGVDVQLTLAGSQVLRLQIEQGARADVFASANESHMAALEHAELVTHALPFASNELVVIVPRSNPAGLTGFEDLPKAERIVIGDARVPVGMYTRKLLEHTAPDFAQAVRARVVSEEANVRLVRAKIELGEADAALVYRTDAAATDKVTTLEIPRSVQVQADYVIAATRASSRPQVAAAFVEFVRSEAGRTRLEARGFVTPR